MHPISPLNSRNPCWIVERESQIAPKGGGERERETDRQTERQRDRQTDRQTERQTDKDTDRQTENKQMADISFSF